MKFDPKMTPMLVKGAVALVAVAAWYFLGKPVDETQVEDVVELLMGLLVGKEFLKPTGSGK